jgi:hypothetical protein
VQGSRVILAVDELGEQLIAAAMTGAARALLDNAPNCSETSMEFFDRGRGERYAFMVQRVGKLTPHEARKLAEARADAAERRLEEGLFVTREQLEAWAGRSLDADDIARLDECVQHSSIPEAIATICGQFH